MEPTQDILSWELKAQENLNDLCKMQMNEVPWLGERVAGFYRTVLEGLPEVKKRVDPFAAILLKEYENKKKEIEKSNDELKSVDPYVTSAQLSVPILELNQGLGEKLLAVIIREMATAGALFRMKGFYEGEGGSR